MPLVKHRDRLSLIADGTDEEGAMTEGQPDHLDEDRFLQDRKNANRGPQLTRIGCLYSPLSSPLHDRCPETTIARRHVDLVRMTELHDKALVTCSMGRVERLRQGCGAGSARS